MSGIKSFVLGFGISLASVSFIGQLYSSSSINKTPPSLDQKIQIQLFKNAEAGVVAKSVDIPPLVSKKTISSTEFKIASIPESTSTQTNGIEDDEILNINVENIIPIELDDNSVDDENIQILHIDENNQLTAMLPKDDVLPEEDTSPWVVAKGSKFIDNKNLIEENNLKENLISDKFVNSLKDDEFISYKVAEKIKQSILFPIPDEILNDENLTPTFIKKKNNTAQDNSKKEKTSIIKKAQKPVEKVETKENKGILTNITSWLKDNNKKGEEKKQEKQQPSYSSANKVAQTQSTTQTTTTNKEQQEKDNFVSFYQTLQDTTQEYEREKIMPSELKLSFRPDRAEISGQTLRWIKAFSEKTKDSKTFLQVRLDASAPIELQKKRLNLLYSIFMNNGVNLDKIDTIFSLTEPNSFIIRILTTD